MNRRSIAETREKRAKRFDEVKLKVASQNEFVRDEILALSLLQLRGLILFILYFFRSSTK